MTQHPRKPPTNGDSLLMSYKLPVSLSRPTAKE